MVRLIRDGNGATGDRMLGDLLKAKSKKGVRVLLLVWDDPTSISIAGYKVTVRNYFSACYGAACYLSFAFFFSLILHAWKVKHNSSNFFFFSFSYYCLLFLHQVVICVCIH
jgi:hypothetical protein